MNRAAAMLTIAAWALAGVAPALAFDLPQAVTTPGLTVKGQGTGKFGPAAPQVFNLPAQITTTGLKVVGQGQGKFGPAPSAVFSLPAQITTSGLSVKGRGPASQLSGKARQ